MNRSGRGQLPLQQSDYTPRRPARLSQPGYKKPVGNQTAQQENKRKKKERSPLDERSTWGESRRASRLFVPAMK